MKQWRGLWLPENETHLVEWMEKVNKIVRGKPTYQYNKYDTAVKLCKHRRRAIDVGGNLGLWSMHMMHDFRVVEAFEPVQSYGDIFVKNAPNANLHRVALGAAFGEVKMVAATKNSCGDTRPWIEGDDPANTMQSSVQMHTLDSYEFTEVDFLKLDCEGYELNVLRGALETLMRCKPVVVVEQKPGHGSSFAESDTAAVDYLRSLGMRQHTVLSGDYVMVW